MIGNEFSSFVCRIDVLRQKTFSKKQYMYYSIYQYSLQMTTILCYRPSMQFTFNRNLGDQQPRNMDRHKQFHTELQTACRCSSWQSVYHGVFLFRRNVLCTQVSTTTYKYMYLSCAYRTSEKISLTTLIAPALLWSSIKVFKSNLYTLLYNKVINN